MTSQQHPNPSPSTTLAYGDDNNETKYSLIKATFRSLRQLVDLQFSSQYGRLKLSKGASSDELDSLNTFINENIQLYYTRVQPAHGKTSPHSLNVPQITLSEDFITIYSRHNGHPIDHPVQYLYDANFLSINEIKQECDHWYLYISQMTYEEDPMHTIDEDPDEIFTILSNIDNKTSSFPPVLAPTKQKNDLSNDDEFSSDIESPPRQQNLHHQSHPVSKPTNALTQENNTIRERGVKQITWNPCWIPFSRTTNGNYCYAIDFDPDYATGGVYGQIIKVSWYPQKRLVFSPSLLQFFTQLPDLILKERIILRDHKKPSSWWCEIM